MNGIVCFMKYGSNAVSCLCWGLVSEEGSGTSLESGLENGDWGLLIGGVAPKCTGMNAGGASDFF